LLSRLANEASGRVNCARGANADEQVGAVERRVNFIHPVRHLAEPDNVGAQRPGNAARGTGRPLEQCPTPFVPRIARRAPCIQMLAVHMEQAFRACPFMQVIDILCDDEQPTFPFGIKPRQRVMRGVRLHFLNPRAAHVVEAQYEIGIACKCLGRRDILDPVLLPQAACAPKGIDSALRAHARAGQDYDIANVGHLPHEAGNSQGNKYMAAIGIIGSAGRMGQALVEAIAGAGQSHAGGVDQQGNLAALIDAADVLVDFSSPAALEATLDACVAAGKPIVIGTTGLEERHHFLIDDAARDIAVLQTGNTSLGVTMLAALVRQAASQLGDDWDIEIAEMHHRHKVDAPSGTALLLGEAAAQGRGIDLKSHSERGRDGITGARSTGAIGFASLRGGSVAGDHLVIFASDNERIELVHRAESRAIFANGAVKAAMWLVRQKAGRYSMNEVLGL
jgi:4-hydroxy-tetrahydrodipicolinate reductase